MAGLAAESLAHCSLKLMLSNPILSPSTDTASACSGELAFDAADSAVRAAVPAGMAELAVNPLAHPLLKLMLPQLKSLLHDSALRVRVAMANLLEVIA